MPARAWRLLPVAAILVGLLAGAPSASATNSPLNWKPCGDAPDVQCATLRAPLDYDHPNGDQVKLFIARSPATGHRIGSLFYNPGGPGGTVADFFETFGADGFPGLNQHFDIIGMDPRGVGQSTPSIDCKVNQETRGIYSEPFATPFNLDVGDLIAKDRRYINRCIDRNDGILAHVSTANVARDMDLLRKALGERKLNYFGYSYGTLLGATYASMFPNNYRAMVLDGPLDADGYINNPLHTLSEQTSGFERALGRFLQACAAHQDACSGFGGDDPMLALDTLIDDADASPIPADGYDPDPRPVDGDDIRAAAVFPLYSKTLWPLMGQMLASAQAGDGTLVRFVVDEIFYGRNPDTGAFDPITDRYFTIGASEQEYPTNVSRYLRAGEHSWAQHEHYYDNNGYTELNYGLWPIHDRDAFDGPFRIPRSSATALVVANRYDPATPYRGALRLASDLGNARLLTMNGDGHTSYGSGSPDCIDPAVEDYLNTLTLPARGTKCKQDIPFAAAQALSAKRAAAKVQRQLSLRRMVRPIVP
jgi:pimeloyl-ACP methyl ester carboxylesterase